MCIFFTIARDGKLYGNSLPLCESPLLNYPLSDEELDYLGGVEKYRSGYWFFILHVLYT